MMIAIVRRHSTASKEITTRKYKVEEQVYLVPGYFVQQEEF
jgi:hypothetical protein